MVEEKILKEVQEMRKMCKKGDDERDAGLPTDIPDVERINDISYGPNGKWNLLDIYLPKQRGEKIPILVNIHGGAWVYGTKETYQFYGLRMAKGGFGVVNFNYTLAPDVEFPGEMDDINRVMHWIDRNADKYHLDIDKTFLTGDSAGAQMVEQYLTIYSNEEYRKLFGYEKPKLKIIAALLNCGEYFLTDPGKLEGVITAYFTNNVQKNKLEMLNTEKFINEEFPPVYLLTANNDFLHNSAFMLAGYLKAKKLNFKIKSYGDKDHLRYHVFHVNQKDEIAEQANVDEIKFLKSFL